MKKILAFAWGVLLPVVLLWPIAAAAQAPLDPSTLTKFIDPLPQPPVRTPSGKRNRCPLYEVRVTSAQKRLHSQLGPTTLFTFDGGALGPTFRIETGQDIFVHYCNDLPLHHLFAVDTTINVMKGRGWGDRSRFVPHLHGGDVRSEDDGWPLSALEPGQDGMYLYANSQPAATLWYHDHAAGITRLNTYAGLAGFYIITDRRESRLNLPSGRYELLVAVQDRTFCQDGQLCRPADWVPEHYGNVALVNGVVWPVQEVEPRRYRFRLLNACNDRFLALKLLEANAAGELPPEPAPGPAFYMVGTEQGLVNNTVVLNDPADPQSPRLLLAPGDRRDVIIDFTGLEGRYFLMHNNASAPFDGTFPPDPANPLPELFLVRVNSPIVRDRSSIPMHPGSLPAPNPTPDLAVRDIFMHELTDASGRVFEALLNDKHFSDPIGINPTLGTAEIWRYINTNRNVHTMHMHLVSFQVLDRQPFDVEHYIRTKELVFTGPPVEPDAQEFGRRDMVNCPAGIVTRVLTSPFNRLGRYLYDCANLGLEENEWMRPFEVVEAQPGGGAGSGFVALEPTAYLGGPACFRGEASISYGVPRGQRVGLKVYSALGRQVRTLVDRPVGAGAYVAEWDGTDDAGRPAPAGAYFYRLETAEAVRTQKTTLLR